MSCLGKRDLCREGLKRCYKKTVPVLRKRVIHRRACLFAVDKVCICKHAQMTRRGSEREANVFCDGSYSCRASSLQELEDHETTTVSECTQYALCFKKSLFVLAHVSIIC